MGALADKHDHPDSKDIRSIIVAGGGTVIATARVPHTHVDFAIVRAEVARSDAAVQKLVKAEVSALLSALIGQGSSSQAASLVSEGHAQLAYTIGY